MASKAQKVDASKKPFTKRLLTLSGRHSTWEVWEDFITVFAVSISNAVDRIHAQEREELYTRIMAKYNAQEQMVFPQLIADVVEALEANPEQDFLGSAYMELELGNTWAGQFFTPYDVCRMMAAVSMPDIVHRVRTDGWVSVNDCACGAGATLIAAAHEAGKRLHTEAGLNWQRHLLFVAQDLDSTAAMMCYIQLSLLGAAGVIKVGNTLTDPMRAADDKRKYWYTPIYFSGIWAARRLLRKAEDAI